MILISASISIRTILTLLPLVHLAWRSEEFFFFVFFLCQRTDSPLISLCSLIYSSVANIELSAFVLSFVLRSYLWFCSKRSSSNAFRSCLFQYWKIYVHLIWGWKSPYLVIKKRFHTQKITAGYCFWSGYTS